MLGLARPDHLDWVHNIHYAYYALATHELHLLCDAGACDAAVPNRECNRPGLPSSSAGTAAAAPTTETLSALAEPWTRDSYDTTAETWSKYISRALEATLLKSC